MTERQKITLFFMFWIGLMGMMASQIQRRLFIDKAESGSGDPLYRLLGSAKEAVGDALFLKASAYFHGGVDTDLIECQESLGKSEGHERGEEPGHAPHKKLVTDWIYRINSQTKVLEHRHLEGEETKEMLPFLKMAVTLDPYNIPAILTTAYWLNEDWKKTDEALAVLKQGLKDNSDSWEIPYRLGLIYFKSKKDRAASVLYLEDSLKKMTTGDSTAIDHRTAYFYLGESYLEQGLKGPALGAYQRALSYFGENEDLSIKHKILERIKTSSR